MLDGAPFQGYSVLEKDGLLHEPNDIILPDNRVSPVPMEQYTLYECHSYGPSQFKKKYS